MAKYFDKFDIPDEDPLSHAGVWDSYSGLGTLKVSSNTVLPSSDNGDRVMTYNGATFEADQFAGVTIATIQGAGQVDEGVVLRFAAPNTISGYVFRAQRNDGPTSAILKVVTGTFTSLASNSAATWAPTDSLQARALVNSLELYRNASLLLSVSDSTFTGSGRVGLHTAVNAAADSGLDDFLGGDYLELFPLIAVAKYNYFPKPAMRSPITAGRLR